MAPSLGHLEYLSNYRVGVISLPVADGKTLRLECVVKANSSSSLVAEFLAGQLAGATLDPKRNCSLFFDTGATPLSLTAVIERVENDQQLRLTAVAPVIHEQKREFFRVDAQVAVNLFDLVREEERKRALIGDSVNISANGILVSFPQALAVAQQVRLMVTLAGRQPYDVTCASSVVRCDRRPSGQYLIAFHFDNIAPADQDKIVAFCFAQQRQQLSLKVRVLGV